MNEHSPPLIDLGRLVACLGDHAHRLDVDCVAECDSTNSVLLARPQAPSGSVVVADRQTAGRGRRGRQWHGEPQDALTFSLLWKFARAPAALSGLPLAVGLALCRGLAAAGCPAIHVKWPNDLLRATAAGWGKVGGILVEMTGERQGASAVIGVGLNLRRPSLSDASVLPPAALSDDDGLERHALLAAVLASLPPLLDAFDQSGFAPFAADWQALHAYAGQPVRLIEAGRVEASGICVGVDADGALLLDCAGRVERWVSGDLSLRPT